MGDVYNAVRDAMRRLNKGKDAWLLYDHGHRTYVCLARCPYFLDGRDVIGHYSFGACRDDILADIGQYEIENPDLRREGKGKRNYVRSAA